MQKEFFNGPLLKENKISYRLYQDNIFNSCKNKNSLVVLPTGLGKTIIGILLIAHSLHKYSQKSKVLVLVPTRPLVFQHKDSCNSFLELDQEKIIALTGKTPPDKRIFLFNKANVIISTPQLIKNDLIKGRYDLKQVSLIIFDEAHKTKGDYSYNFISKEYINACNDPLIIGLTASPGKDVDCIQQLCNNLYVENIVFKTYRDKDVKDYIYDIDVFFEKVDLPIKFIEISEILNHLFKKFLTFFIERNLINPYKKYYSKLDFLRISQDLTISLKYDNESTTNQEKDDYGRQLYFQTPKLIDIVKEKSLDVHSIFSYCSSCISLLHSKDLLETQDISIFKSYLEKIKWKSEENILSANRIANSQHFKLINYILEKNHIHHPKIKKLISIVREELNEFKNKKIIIFTQYREMAENLKLLLKSEFSNQLIIEKFIGQAMKFEDCGFSQIKQIEILNDFRKGNVNVLIATSVAEEGLDIPNVDAIIFYEPVPSEIRLIQRRGRTGRCSPGRCYILLTENSVDIPFHIVAKKKEENMNSILANPNLLSLGTEIKRIKINFENAENQISKLQLIEKVKHRKEIEKEFLMNKSIDEIISSLDTFSKSKLYSDLKDYGVILLSDLVNLEKSKLSKRISRLKEKTNKQKKNKQYLNKNIKTLINIIKLSENNRMSFREFQDLAEEEDILGKIFYVHFNQACNLGYLKKQADLVELIKDYE